MIALTFALPDESRDFVAALTERASLRNGAPLPVIVGRSGAQKVVVIHTGVGELPAYRRRLEQWLTGNEKPRLLISSGYAGGLQAGNAVGDLILANNISDASLLAKVRELLAHKLPIHVGSLKTQPATAETAEAKRALGVATGAIAVDMESGWIFDLCATAGVPMLSLRVISDAVEQAFPVPGALLFDARRQRPRYFALPAWLLAHPSRIRPFIRFVRGLGPARARLTGALQTVIAGI